MGFFILYGYARGGLSVPGSYEYVGATIKESRHFEATIVTEDDVRQRPIKSSESAEDVPTAV